jgi:hypothetical protein
MNRRQLIGSGALTATLAASGLGLSGCSVSLTNVKAYANAAYQTLVKLEAVIAPLSPTAAAVLSRDLTAAYSALQAINALTSPTNAAGTAALFIGIVEDGLSVAAALPLPPAVQAAIAAAEILLATIGSFLGAPVPMPAANADHMAAVQTLRDTARVRYAAAPDKPALANAAYRQVRAFLATP